MQTNIGKPQLLEKMFLAASKAKLSQLTRRHNYGLFQLWRQFVRQMGLRLNSANGGGTRL